MPLTPRRCDGGLVIVEGWSPPLERWRCPWCVENSDVPRGLWKSASMQGREPARGRLIQAHLPIAGDRTAAETPNVECCFIKRTQAYVPEGRWHRTQALVAPPLCLMPLVQGWVTSQPKSHWWSVDVIECLPLPCGCSFKVKVLVAQLCLTLWGPVDCNPPGSSVHGISQARIVEWVVILFSRGSSCPRAQTHVSCLAGRSFTTEPPGKSELLFRWEQSQGVEVSPTVVRADSVLPPSSEKAPPVHLQVCLTGNKVDDYPSTYSWETVIRNISLVFIDVNVLFFTVNHSRHWNVSVILDAWGEQVFLCFVLDY